MNSMISAYTFIETLTTSGLITAKKIILPVIMKHPTSVFACLPPETFLRLPKIIIDNIVSTPFPIENPITK